MLFDMLRSIADDLSDETSPQTLARCADFFIDNKKRGKKAALEIEKQARAVPGHADDRGCSMPPSLSMSPPKAKGSSVSLFDEPKEAPSDWN